MSFKLGQAFEKASQGGDVAAFNALVDQWNAWVASTFGNDASLIMEKMTGPINLQKPYYAPGNNTTNSLREHQMDSRAEYTTNDVNLLSDQAIAKYAASRRERLWERISWAGFKNSQIFYFLTYILNHFQRMTKNIAAKTAKRLASMPLSVTDGLKFYARVLLEQYGFWRKYPANGKRGRLRRERLAPCKKLWYAWQNSDLYSCPTCKSFDVLAILSGSTFG